jgi:hypothetical protein
MSISVTAYYRMADRQSTDWLRRSANDPGPFMRPIHVAIQKLVLRKRDGLGRVATTCLETAYDTTQRLSFQIKVF